jgi:TM2 domain-containing membrane protein YozV
VKYCATQRGGKIMNKTTLVLISIFLGFLGIDRFCVGKIGTGILKLLTGAGLGIW